MTTACIRRNSPARISIGEDLYPKGIKIYPESKLAELIKEFDVDDCVFAYSDKPYAYVMGISAIVNAAGANFWLMGPKDTMVKSKKPCVTPCLTIPI